MLLLRTGIGTLASTWIHRLRASHRRRQTPLPRRISLSQQSLS
jgi:hypothetical protein